MRPRPTGAALTAAIVVITILSALAAFALSFAFNQQRLMNSLSRGYTKAHFAAQAGVVNAHWRIRKNYTTDIGGGSFANPLFNPPVYYIDIDANTISTIQNTNHDVSVDIGPVNTTGPFQGLRDISAVGND